MGEVTTFVPISTDYIGGFEANTFMGSLAGSAIVALLCFPHINKIVVCSADGVGQCCDMVTGQLIGTFSVRVKNHNCLIRLDDTTFVTGSTDGLVEFWNINSLQRIKTIKTRGDCITQLVASLDGEYILSLTNDLIFVLSLFFNRVTLLSMTMTPNQVDILFSPCTKRAVAWDTVQNCNVITCCHDDSFDAAIMSGSLTLSNRLNKRDFDLCKKTGNLRIVNDNNRVSFMSLLPSSGAHHCYPTSPISFSIRFNLEKDEVRKHENCDSYNSVEFTAPSEYHCDMWVEIINAMIMDLTIVHDNEDKRSTKNIMCRYRFDIFQLFKLRHCDGRDYRQHRGVFGLPIAIEIMELIGFYTMK